MKIHYWNTVKIRNEIIGGSISSDEKFIYLLSSFLIYAIASYVGAIFVVSSEGWLLFFEGLIVIIITLYGIINCRNTYFCYSEDKFIENCIILSVPLSVKFFLFSWLAYFLVEYGIYFSIRIVEEMPSQAYKSSVNFIYIYHPFIISVVGQAVFFLRLKTHLAALRG